MNENSAILAYCVVANVAEETAMGDGGMEIRRGTRHFSAGAKVWVLPPQWGDGAEKIPVVGRHRGSGRYTRLVISRAHLTNFRVRGIYSPAVIRELIKPWKRGSRSEPRFWWTELEAVEAVEWWSTPSLEARFDDLPYTPMVSDPPPLELEKNGKTYYLAHFNARRALYSSQPPPMEKSPTI